MLFSREIAQAATGMAPGLTGIVGGRPTVWPKIRLYSCLVPKDGVAVSVNLNDEMTSVDVDSAGGFQPGQIKDPLAGKPASAADTTVRLVDLAWARSGDKGDHSNIGVIARNPEFVPFIEAALTEEAVAKWMAHTLNPETGKVTRWALPGFHAFNFLLEHSLGGGGIASLRIDPQGKPLPSSYLNFQCRCLPGWFAPEL